MAEGGGKRRATHLLSCLIFFFSASVSLSFLTGAFLMGMVSAVRGSNAEAELAEIKTQKITQN